MYLTLESTLHWKRLIQQQWGHRGWCNLKRSRTALAWFCRKTKLGAENVHETFWYKLICIVESRDPFCLHFTKQMNFPSLTCVAVPTKMGPLSHAIGQEIKQKGMLPVHNSTVEGGWLLIQSLSCCWSCRLLWTNHWVSYIDTDSFMYMVNY